MKKITVATILAFGTLFFWGNKLNGQNSFKGKMPLKQEMPMVFMLGEYNQQYGDLASNQATLLDVCDRDMNFAYSKLMGMMREMESYAEAVDFELKGVSAWMHFFWHADGSIDHIAFHLKPNSRNIGIESMKSFLEGFAKQYKLPVKSSKRFCHYSSFSFPIAKQAVLPVDSPSPRTSARSNNVHND